MEEMFDVFTKEGEYLGTRPASVCRSENPGFYYKVVRVILLNENNEILIQKRSNNVVTFPGLWEVSASGHVDQGENELDAAIRETKEEVGVLLDANNIRLIHTSINKNALTYTYIARIRNNTQFTLQKEEVDEVKYVSLFEFKNIIYTDEFTPKENGYFEFLLNYFINTLKMDDRDIIKRSINEKDLVKSMDKINEDDNVKEGIELEGSLKIIDIVITLLLLLLVGIVIFAIIKI
jgi:isopentenyldiphosphate isomerase